MITDLMRNDLSRISDPGTVKTVKIWQCEAFSNVYHLHAQIEAQAKKDLLFPELFRLVFPGGSISGCPKLKAMEVIASIENRPRGLYTGCIGYLTARQDFDFNIAIRTLLYDGEKLELKLGGGIVYDSVPEKEYEETLYKGRNFFSLLGLVNEKVGL